MRNKPAAVAMKAHFRRRMRDGTLKPMWFDQDKIASWLCDRKKDKKDRRKMAKKEQKSEKLKLLFVLGSVKAKRL